MTKAFNLILKTISILIFLHKNISTQTTLDKPKLGKYLNLKIILTISEQWIKKIENFIENDFFERNNLEKLIQEGQMGGFFRLDEVYYLVSYLSQKYPQFISPLFSIGKTYQNKNILAFAFGKIKGKIRKKN